MLAQKEFKKELKREKLIIEKEVEKSFVSGQQVSELERVNEFYGRALSVYTDSATCPSILGRELKRSLSGHLESGEVGSVGEILRVSQTLTQNSLADEDFAAQLQLDLH